MSSDDDSQLEEPWGQRKIGPQHWNAVPIQEVGKLPEGINGVCCYRILCDIKDTKARLAALKDGRSWKKDTRTDWAGYGRVRYANCKGSYKCANSKCMYLVEYGVVNSVQFKKIDGQMLCSLCESKPEYIPCDARRYLAIMSDAVKVYHYGNHKCNVKPSSDKSKKKDDVVKEYIRKNPDAKPSQVQSAYILSMVRNRQEWSKVDKQAEMLLNTKWISNKKQEVRKETEPHGNNFEAVANFKQYCDQNDPFYIYKMNDKRGNPDKPSFVFKSSSLKAKIAINMNKDKEHFLSQEFCFFDGKHKRAKGYVTLTASVYHPLLRRQIPLATMDAEAEDSRNVTLFWELFNEVIQKVTGGEVRCFNPVGWCTDMAGSNLSAIQNVFGEEAIHRIKTCEFHFKESVNRRSRFFSGVKVNTFKELAVQLLECVTPECYENTKEKLKAFIEREGNKLADWLEWWDLRKGFVFRAFAPFGPRMNQAESVHGGWAKKDPANMTLLKVAEADVRESKILDVEYEGLKTGTSTARGWGPSCTERQRTTHLRQIEAAKKLGEEMFGRDNSRNGRVIDQNSSHRPPEKVVPSTKRKSKKGEKTKNKKQKSQSKKDNERPHIRTEKNRDIQSLTGAIPIPSTPARQVPQFGTFVIGLLQYQHPSVKTCYGCGGELKPGGMIPDSPQDLVIVSGDKRRYYNVSTKTMTQNQKISNVYFHLNPNCVTLRYQYFSRGLVKVPQDLTPFLEQAHKDILKEVIGLTIP
jgi:hypothetical protein